MAEYRPFSEKSGEMSDTKQNKKDKQVKLQKSESKDWGPAQKKLEDAVQKKSISLDDAREYGAWLLKWSPSASLPVKFSYNEVELDTLDKKRMVQVCLAAQMFLGKLDSHDVPPAAMQATGIAVYSMLHEIVRRHERANADALYLVADKKCVLLECHIDYVKMLRHLIEARTQLLMIEEFIRQFMATGKQEDLKAIRLYMSQQVYLAVQMFHEYEKSRQHLRSLKIGSTKAPYASKRDFKAQRRPFLRFTCGAYRVMADDYSAKKNVTTALYLYACAVEAQTEFPVDDLADSKTTDIVLRFWSKPIRQLDITDAKFKELQVDNERLYHDSSPAAIHIKEPPLLSLDS